MQRSCDITGTSIGRGLSSAISLRGTFATADYLSASARMHGAEDSHAPLSGERVEAHWDAKPSVAMSERKIPVHEEAMPEILLRDLAG